MTSALSADAKDALAREIPDSAEERGALLRALVRFGSSDGSFRTQRLAVARLVATLIAQSPYGTPGSTPRVERRERRRLVRGSDFSVVLPPALVDAVAEREAAGAAPAATASPAPKVKRGERRVELRAAFLSCGSIAEPARGYHLEFTLRSAVLAARVVRLIRAEGPAAKTIERKARFVVYLKNIDAIVAVLGALGAYGAVLRLEDVRALKETKNRIRRLVNTEAANVDRAAAAAASQRERIAYVADAYGLSNLSPALREVAELRLRHPTETLAELGRLCDPPLKKSTVNGRIAALLRLAARLDGRVSAAQPAHMATSSREDASPFRH